MVDDLTTVPIRQRGIDDSCERTATSTLKMMSMMLTPDGVGPSNDVNSESRFSTHGPQVVMSQILTCAGEYGRNSLGWTL